MSNKVFHLRVELGDEAREFLLGVYPPRFMYVHCRFVTLAYGQGRYMEGAGIDRTVTIYGRHDGPTTDALLCEVDGEMFQPKREGESFRRPIHITLSCALGVSPSEAGRIDPDRTKLFDQGHTMPGLRAVLRRARVSRPERRPNVATG